MSVVPVLLLTQKAEVKSSKITLGNSKELTLKHIQTYCKKKTEVEVIGTYGYKGITLFLFGFTKGKAGSENKHELPPPHDNTLVFGDIILVASKSDTSPQHHPICQQPRPISDTFQPKFENSLYFILILKILEFSS